MSDRRVGDRRMGDGGGEITRHEYRVRYEQSGPGGGPVQMEVRGSVDLVAETISFELPSAAVDVVAARALLSILFEGIYGSLRPGGPQLVLEKNTGDGWPDETQQIT